MTGVAGRAAKVSKTRFYRRSSFARAAKREGKAVGSARAMMMEKGRDDNGYEEGGGGDGEGRGGGEIEGLVMAAICG